MLLEKDQRYEQAWRDWISGVVNAYGEERLRGVWEKCIESIEAARRDQVSTFDCVSVSPETSSPLGAARV